MQAVILQKLSWIPISVVVVGTLTTQLGKTMYVLIKTHSPNSKTIIAYSIFLTVHVAIKPNPKFFLPLALVCLFVCVFLGGSILLLT